MLEQVLEYAARGWHVLPCRGKVPYTSHGVKDATIDKELIKEWWSQWPEANVAIATGTISGIDVLDIDSNEILQTYDTRTIQTPRGFHYYFKALNQGCAVRIRPGTDIRGNGGYVVAPPSPGYSLIRDQKPLADWPAIAPIKAMEPFGAGLFEGEGRDIALYKYCCWMRGQGLEWDDALARAHARNATFVPPFPEHIVVQKMEQAWKRPAPISIGSDLLLDDTNLTFDLSTAKVEPVEWLWENRIQAGTIALLNGAYGVGKSLLAMYIAEHVSQQGKNVLFLQYENFHGLVRRLSAIKLGAGRINCWDPKKLPVLPRDLAKLQSQVAKEDDRLIIFDIFVSAIPGLNYYDDQQVHLLDGLERWLAEEGRTALWLNHVNKKEGISANLRGMGSVALPGMASNVYLMGRSPDDPKRSILATLKNREGEFASSLEFEFMPSGASARLNLVGPSLYTADDLVAPPRPPTIEEKAKAVGISRSTYYKYKLDEGGQLPTKETTAAEKAAEQGISRRTYFRQQEMALSADSGTLGGQMALSADTEPNSTKSNT